MGSHCQGAQTNKFDHRQTENTFRIKTEDKTEARVEVDFSTKERRAQARNNTIGLLERSETGLGQGKESYRKTQITRQAKRKSKGLLGRSAARMEQRKKPCGKAKC